MSLTPGYGQTPLPHDELAALLPEGVVVPLGRHAAQIYAEFATDHAGLDFRAVIETLRG